MTSPVLSQNATFHTEDCSECTCNEQIKQKPSDVYQLRYHLPTCFVWLVPN